MKRGFYLLFFVLCTLQGFGQREIYSDTPKSFKDRVYFGGGGGFSGGTDAYGNQYFVYYVTPMIGYMITPQFSGGTGLLYQNQTYSSPIDVTIEQWGFMPFLRYNFNEFYLTTEFQYINTPVYYTPGLESKFYSRLFFGVGYAIPLGGRARLNMQGMYDVLHQSNGPFASPWSFRVFFSI